MELDQQPTTNSAPTLLGQLPTVRVARQWVVRKYEPVIARIIGPGTSSVVVAGAVNSQIPEGAILISQAEPRTGTSAVASTRFV